MKKMVLLVVISHAIVYFIAKRQSLSEIVLKMNVPTTPILKEKHSSNKDKWEIEALPIMKSITRGFHPVYIYSKAVPETLNTYSQVSQDRMILALIKAHNEKDNIPSSHIGFFVDLASNDALSLSNSYLLEQSGWNGLCIEPNPIYWYRLASFRKCTIVGAFVGGAQEGDGTEVDVVLSNGVFGGIAGAEMDNKESNEKEFRNVVSITTIFQETNVPSNIDYFSLDVEGAESLVMDDFPWESYTIKFFSIERPKNDLKEKLVEHGYKMVKVLSNFGETLWIHSATVRLSQDEIDNILKPLCTRCVKKSALM